MISVVIPTYIRTDRSILYFKQLIDSIEKQINVKFEVIICDNSEIHYSGFIKEIINHCKIKNIQYVYNPAIGASENFNFGIKKATYDKIKIMCQDDLLESPLALSKFSDALNTHYWAVCNSIWRDKNGKTTGHHDAYYNNQMIKGVNTIGMPSVMAFKKNEFEFDLNLKTLIDCEFYWWLMQKYGAPCWINLRLVAERFHPNSTSNNQRHRGKEEYEYLKSKYNLK